MSEAIETYGKEMASIEDIYRLLPAQHGRRLTIPAIFNRSYDENFISDYLAYILDPEINGIGVAPLNALLNLVDEDSIASDSAVKIDREFTFKDGGRIDFLIHLDEEKIIGIENKITAFEGVNQTASYDKSIASEFPNTTPCLIFLTPQDTQATSPHFKTLKYTNLFKALRELPFSSLADIHKNVLWEDFLAHLEEYIIMGNKTLDLNEKTRLYLKHQNMLDELTRSLEEDAKNRQNYALARIKELFSDWDAYGRPSDRSHWYVKNNWYLGNGKGTYVFAQFPFQPEDFVKSQKIVFSVGAYPINEVLRPFNGYFLANYSEAVKAFCTQFKMQAFPKIGGPNFWIAWKEYPYDPIISTEIDRVFSTAREELKPLEEIIDRALATYEASKNTPI